MIDIAPPLHTNMYDSPLVHSSVNDCSVISMLTLLNIALRQGDSDLIVTELFVKLSVNDFASRVKYPYAGNNVMRSSWKNTTR